jgi:putative membrane protein insertion efficiency factor
MHSTPASLLLEYLYHYMAHAALVPVNIPARLILWLLALYKRWLSPLLGPRCRFHPSCSDYARIAVTRFGPWRGSLLTAWRLLRCQPLCTGGEDPVPQHFHFVRCGEHPPPADPGVEDSR